MRLWYLSHRRPAKAQASLRIRAVSPEPSLFAHRQTKGQTKRQTSSLTVWLCMRIWRMNLRRTKRTKISWAGSFELRHDKTSKMSVRPAKTDQPGHPPSLIKVFAVRMKKAWVLSNPLSAQRRLWSDWADAQADLSLRWAHSHIFGFVMSRLILWFFGINWAHSGIVLNIQCCFKNLLRSRNSLLVMNRLYKTRIWYITFCVIIPCFQRKSFSERMY